MFRVEIAEGLKIDAGIDVFPANAVREVMLKYWKTTRGKHLGSAARSTFIASPSRSLWRWWKRIFLACSPIFRWPVAEDFDAFNCDESLAAGTIALTDDPDPARRRKPMDEAEFMKEKGRMDAR